LLRPSQRPGSLSHLLNNLLAVFLVVLVEARQAVNAAFDAMSAWRIDTAKKGGA
jgi:hypothetical protein